MRHCYVFALALGLAGCFASVDDARSNVDGEKGNAAAYDTDACKIEGSQIGREGYVMKLGERRVTFQDWVGKPGEPNEYMGFSLALDGTEGVGYIVKAGSERYPSRDTSWSHPLGMTANAISNVDMCEECTDGGCDDGGGDGGGDGCIECPPDGDGSGSGSDGPLT